MSHAAPPSDSLFRGIVRECVPALLAIGGALAALFLLKEAADTSSFLVRWESFTHRSVIMAAGAVVALSVGRCSVLVESRFSRRAFGTANPVDDFLCPLAGQVLRVLLLPLLATYALVYYWLPESFRHYGLKLPPIIFILAAGWIIFRMICVAETFFLRRNIGPEDAFDHRSLITRVRLLRRISTVILLFFMVAALLTLFDQLRSLGASLFASAGVAGIVIGLAAQRTFGSMFAGIQIALAQPVRIGDQISIENETGTIEEMTLTYAVVKLWDLRRLVVPITYFLEQPFQNWTRSSTNVIGTVFLRVDFSAPVDRLRKRFKEIVAASPHWNGKACALHVSDSDDVSLQLRLTASAATSAESWELRCEIREKMSDFLVRELPLSLPRARNEQKAVNDWSFEHA
jgi:small-conductance mechanosensitive channel